jgi:adenylate kinase family enzyme
MITATQYRAKAAEYTELLKAARLPAETREFRKREQSYLTLAENEEWMADNLAKMDSRDADENWYGEAILAQQGKHPLGCRGADVATQSIAAPTPPHASVVRPIFESISQRTVIIGNSGAGKSAFAENLSALIHVPVIDLDLLNWEGDGYGRKRDEDTARRMTLDVSARPLWIIEGVYGWLAESALPRATALIWLDFQWSLCRAGLLARSPRRGATDQDGVELLKWAETYWNRQTSSSFAGHSRMFSNFSGTKFRLESREQATLLLADLRTCTTLGSART